MAQVTIDDDALDSLVDDAWDILMGRRYEEEFDGDIRDAIEDKARRRIAHNVNVMLQTTAEITQRGVLYGVVRDLPTDEHFQAAMSNRAADLLEAGV